MAKKDTAAADADTASYEVLAPTYLDRLYDKVGEIIPWDGVPNAALKPLNAAAKAAVEQAKADRAERSRLVEAKLTTADIPRTASAPPGIDVKALTKRAEDAEFSVAEFEEKTEALAKVVLDEFGGPQPDEDVFAAATRILREQGEKLKAAESSAKE